jgi:hypothetical protein
MFWIGLFTQYNRKWLLNPWLKHGLLLYFIIQNNKNQGTWDWSSAFYYALIKVVYVSYIHMLLYM